jgi:tetratricopeptide (TPR) repeat protein
LRRDQLTLLTLIASLAIGGTAVIAFDKSGKPGLVTSALGKELVLVPRVTEEAPISLTASDGTGLKLTSLHAESVVVDPLSFTELRMTFQNPDSRVLEGRFSITLPPGASVSRFAMKIDGKWQEAEVVEKQRARQTYEDFLHRRQDPALLEQGAGNSFSARVFPIPPNGVKEIVIAYSQELADARATIVPLAGLRAVGALDVAVNFPAGGTAPRRFTAQNGDAPGDVVLVREKLGERDGVRNAGEAIVKVRVPDDGGRDELSSLLVLVDTSASRALGFERELETLSALVKSLGGSRVCVMAFDQTTERIFEGQASGFGARELDRLRARGALGATDLFGALDAAAREVEKNGLKRVVLLGDGVTTAFGKREQKLGEAQKKLKASGVERFDVIAFGGIRDEAALAALVSGEYPKAGVVARGELEFAEVASRLTRRSVKELPVKVEGALWSYPDKLSGIQAGDERLVYVQSDPSQPVKVSLGDAPAREMKLAEAPQPLVERALAKAKIDSLIEGNLPADEKRQQVVELSVARRVLSPYTSLLVLETELDYRRYGIERSALANILSVERGKLVVINRRALGVDSKFPEEAPPLVTPQVDNKEGGTGVRAKGEDGSMGRLKGGGSAQRFAVQGPADNAAPAAEPQPSPAAPAATAAHAESAPEEARELGMLGLLNQPAGGAPPSAPAAPPRTSTAPNPVGGDELSVRGNMWGDDIGDAFGGAGLGLTGTGSAGPGVSNGIGLGSIGAGHGRLGGSHATSGLKVRSGTFEVRGKLPKEVVQRIVRQNFGRFRLCYEQALARNPNLEGNLGVEFVIDKSGSVANARPNGARQINDAAMLSCVVAAHYGLSFPAPESGVVVVNASLGFSTDGQAGPPALESPADVQSRFFPAQRPGASPPSAPINPEWPATPTGYEGRFAEVMRAIGDKNPGGALGRARAYREEAPGDVMALVALGQAMKASGDLPGAARAFGSIIDLFPDRADLRRFAGVELEGLDTDAALRLAEDSFRKAQEDRPDHASTYRLLAYSLVKQKHYAEAFDYLEKALEQGQRYQRQGTEQIMREDLGLIAAAWQKAEPSRRESILERLSRAGGVLEDAPSTRFVLNWETDANDVDLHVYDGLGDHAYYGRKQLSSGGFLYADVTNGYGPECFILRGPSLKPVKKYTLQVHYYARGPMGFGMGKLQIVRHDGKGGLSFDERPFVVMQDKAHVDLGGYVPT